MLGSHCQTFEEMLSVLSSDRFLFLVKWKESFGNLSQKCLDGVVSRHCLVNLNSSHGKQEL